jgi:hypothetical protein
MPQELEEGESFYQGRSWNRFVFYEPRSQSRSFGTIVVAEYELRIDTAEVSQNDEGLNINPDASGQIKQGSACR